MSHEIRTPLNGFRLNLMREEAKDPYWRSKMDEIDSLGKILLGILNDILDFSKSIQV